jgi:hypothetical protein
MQDVYILFLEYKAKMINHDCGNYIHEGLHELEICSPQDHMHIEEIVSGFWLPRWHCHFFTMYFTLNKTWQSHLL